MGRPKGTKSIKNSFKVLINVDKEEWEEFKELAYINNENASSVMRKLIKKYIINN